MLAEGLSTGLSMIWELTFILVALLYHWLFANKNADHTQYLVRNTSSIILLILLVYFIIGV